MVSRHSIVSVQDMCMDLDKFPKKMFAVILSFCKLEVWSRVDMYDVRCRAYRRESDRGYVAAVCGNRFGLAASIYILNSQVPRKGGGREGGVSKYWPLQYLPQRAKGCVSLLNKKGILCACTWSQGWLPQQVSGRRGCSRTQTDWICSPL